MFSPRILMVLSALILSAPVNAASSKKSVPSAPPAESVPASPTVIELSHRIDEERAERLQPAIEHFNNSQKSVHINVVRRVEGDAPKHLNLVTREEYARFMTSQAKFRPLFEVMKEAKEPFDSSSFSPELRDSLAGTKGQLIALPLAFSTPVLYINKEDFRKAGLNPEMPPKTWLEMQNVSAKLFEAGVRCPYTTSWPVRVFIDNTSAWNGANLDDGKGNLAINGLVQVKHIAMMASWYKAKFFHTFGRRDEADRRFANGECAMLTSSSSLFASLVESKTIEVGVSALPYHDDVYGAPKNTLADGASIWVSNSLKPAETKAVAKFVKYVLSPEVQIKMTLAGGFLPMTPVARAAASSTLLNADLAGLHVAYAQLQGKASSPVIRTAQIEPVRTILEEELEAVWANRKPAKEALDSAVQRSNAVLRPMPVAKVKGKRGK